MSNITRITTPVGRLVQGSLYNPNTTSMNGEPLIYKTGSKAGQPRQEFYIAIAIPKNGESHWNQTSWGKVIWDTAVASSPNMFQNGVCIRDDFAFKVMDGDSQKYDQNGTVINTKEGFAGNWVVKFTNGYPPKIYNASGTVELVEKDHVKRGYFIQVSSTVEGNNDTSKPGVYLNFDLVAFSAFGEEIVGGVDVATAGFGQGTTLPQGASTTPPIGMSNAQAHSNTAPAPTQASAPAPAPAQASASAPAPAPEPTPTPAPEPAPAQVIFDVTASDIIENVSTMVTLGEMGMDVMSEVLTRHGMSSLSELTGKPQTVLDQVWNDFGLDNG